jgi:protein-tyrosine phosphatase
LDFVDLHCHWLPAVDDGARTPAEGHEMLRRLREIGFSHVVATPHLRPGLFHGTPESHREAFQAALPGLDLPELPSVSLASEHFFDPEVVRWILAGQGLPYGKGGAVAPSAERTESRAVLIEFRDLGPWPAIEELLFQLGRARYIAVIAHPERYPAVWSEPEMVDRLLDRGAVLLLDVAAVVGKYGRRSQETALRLLDLEAYEAACTDSHRPEDVTLAGAGMELVRERYGKEELDFLFRDTPARLLQGLRPTPGP